MNSASIVSVATATPPYRVDQAFAKELMMRHYAEKLSPRNLEALEKVFSHPSVKQRHFAFDDAETIFTEDPDSRIARFTRWSIELSSAAISEALSLAGVAPDKVTGLVVNTCTGYLCPGISTYLIERLGLNRAVRAYDLVGSGCGGAVPNLQISASLANESEEAVVVSVSSEICSATFQMADDLGLIVSNALFSDGAAAAVLRRSPDGLEPVSSSNFLAPEHRDKIRYVYRCGELHNQLSPYLSLPVRKAVAQVVAGLLMPLNLKVGDIRHWALHTGGEKIIAAIKSELGLTEAQLGPTRSVLENYGNMSSPTVWFVLRELLDKGIDKGDWCLMIAFGAGLSAHGYLLRKR